MHSKFTCPAIGHVITGDCTLIENPTLRELFLKGTKYREPVQIDWENVLSIAQSAVELFVTALHKKTKVPLSAFLKYREKACHIAEKRVRQCRVMHCNLPVVPWTLQ
ncbi:MAG: hypothetical protein GY861_11115, partial [bacterium]|nr:hypothetical protein [bacterium]